MTKKRNFDFLRFHQNQEFRKRLEFKLKRGNKDKLKIETSSLILEPKNENKRRVMIARKYQ
jgi:hypothetical protein